MHELKTRLAAELPLIENALRCSIATLPHAVQPIAEHIFLAGGKRLRPFLTVLMARLLGYDKDDIYTLASSMEMLHMATLLHDDVIDNAHTRRGKAAAHTLFGVNSVILGGDALLAGANSLVARFDDTRLCQCFSEATLQTASGEILEIQYMRRLDQDEHIYEDIITGKTAWLLRASCELGALRANAKSTVLKEITTYGQQLGMAFQIVDDALDFAPEEETGKPTGGDLREGKFTPLVRLYRNQLAPLEQERFDAAFTAGTFTASDATHIGTEIRRLGLDNQVRHMAQHMLQKAIAALNTLPKGPEQRVLEQMTIYVQNRKK